MNSINKIQYIIFIVSLIFFYISGLLPFLSGLGISLFLFYGTKIFLETGQKIIIKDILIIIALVQWIIGPILAYNFNADEKMYFMAVPEELYMEYVVPASIFLIIGLYLPFGNKNSDDYYLKRAIQTIKTYPKLDLILTLGGFLIIQLWRFAPLSLKFFIAILGSLQYIGLFFILINPTRKYKTLYIYGILSILALSSLSIGMFHDFILWTVFILLFSAFIFKPTIIKKLIYLTVFITLVVSIQTVKFYFREALNKGVSGDISLFTDLVQKKIINSDYLYSEVNKSAMITRVNQGWIIARIMSWTPSREPFAEGETIIEAIKASLMPRFLFPEKVIAGGRNNFTRFTGKQISDNTSMGLGLIGEAYANYGILGGIFFMFLIGVFYNLFILKIYKIGDMHPTIIFFIPLIFLQVIKAETDFSVILNHLIKTTIVVWIIYFGINKFLGIQI